MNEICRFIGVTLTLHDMHDSTGRLTMKRTTLVP